MPTDTAKTPGIDARTSAAIRGLSAARQIPHAHLAALCEIGTTQFSAKMRGKSPWKLREVAALAAYFGLTIDDLVEGRFHLAD